MTVILSAKSANQLIFISLISILMGLVSSVWLMLCPNPLCPHTLILIWNTLYIFETLPSHIIAWIHDRKGLYIFFHYTGFGRWVASQFCWEIHDCLTCLAWQEQLFMFMCLPRALTLLKLHTRRHDGSTKQTYSSCFYRGSPTYTKITNTVSTTTVFGLCRCKWGIFAVVGDPLQSH